MYDYEFPLSDGADIEQTLNMKWDRKNSFNARDVEIFYSSQAKTEVCLKLAVLMAYPGLSNVLKLYFNVCIFGSAVIGNDTFCFLLSS